MLTITVRPLEGKGWTLEVEGVFNPQVFRSGARAELAAKALARRLTLAGEAAPVKIHLRDGSSVATTAHPPGVRSSWPV